MTVMRTAGARLGCGHLHDQGIGRFELQPLHDQGL